MSQTPLRPELFAFLKQLARNNNREWFQSNKSRYEVDVRDPLLEFVREFAPRLHKISPHYLAIDRAVGGSLFRIHRDTRFSRDKSPYKTWAALQFRHKQGKDVHAPGFYLHLQPGNVFVGVGVWHPDGTTLGTIRDAIVDDPPAWKRARDAKAFKSQFELAGDSLKRPPRGIDADHPYVDDLKRKDFIAVAEFSENDALAPDFMTRFARASRSATPFMKFLNDAVGLPW